MPQHQDPVKELLALESRRPQEPFLDRAIYPRRPNNYRNMPEYKDWEAATKEHEHELTLWYRENIRLCSSGPGHVELRLAGRPLSGYCFQLKPNGCVALDLEYGEHLYPHVKTMPPDWTRPLEIPGRIQNLESFRKDNRGRDSYPRNWNLEQAVSYLERKLPNDHHRLPGRELRSVAWELEDILESFIGQVRDLLDSAPLRFLNKLNGGAPGKPWTLLDYNLAIYSRDVLEQVAAVTPGAAALWLYMWQENILFPLPSGSYSPYREQPQLPPPRFPEHPAEIIKPVKDWFDSTAFTPCWKALVSQPAEHVRRQLRRQRNSKSGLDSGPSNWELTLWTAERLRQANIAGQAVKRPVVPPPPGPEPKPEPPALDQMSMLTTDRPAAAPPPRPKLPRTPPPEPPLNLKLLAAQIRYARTAPGLNRNARRAMLGMPPQGPAAPAPDQERDQVPDALNHLVELVLRHYAGAKGICDGPGPLKRLKSRLEDIADYCWSQPAQSLQAKTFSGLAKASVRWHQDYILRQLARQLAEVDASIAEAGPESAAEWTRGWDCPLPELKEKRWQARCLPNAYELLQESVVMDHCVGDHVYRRDCEYGYARIYHLQPRPPGAAPGWQPNPAEARQEGSTLEVYRFDPDQPDSRWRVHQHRGYKNVQPDPDAAAFADRVAEALNKASR